MDNWDDTTSILIDNSEDHYVEVFDLTSTQDATQTLHYPEQIVEPSKLESNFTFPEKHVL